MISISEKIKLKLPDLILGIIESKVVIMQCHPDLCDNINLIAKDLKMELSEVSTHPAINASRKAYKILGKDPARYRLSAEALMRRVTRGIDLPQVNNIVDLINFVSLQTGMSIGGYDAAKIKGDILMDTGDESEDYDAIGRGKLNIGNLPVLRDDFSAFGSPTSDSERTSVTGDTTKFLMVIFGFSGEENTIRTMELSVKLLNRYAEASNITTYLIR